MFKLCVAACIVLVCACTSAEKQTAVPSADTTTFALYSPVVKDSFYVSVQLPDDYKIGSKMHYPVVYMLDANFYFPMMASVCKQYERAGLLPPVILVGIGYKTFELMDSLRQRDDLYPASLPKDEIQVQGGGLRFNEFLVQQLVPQVDSLYRTDTHKRVLMGHSFGGYFTLLALLQQSSQSRSTFSNFIAASPSLWYRDYYLQHLPDSLQLHAIKDSTNIFLTAGGLENQQYDIQPMQQLAKNLQQHKLNHIHVVNKVYSNLEHMDMAVLSFTKGLQEFFLPKE